MAIYLKVSRTLYVRVGPCEYESTLVVSGTLLFVVAQAVAKTADLPDESPCAKGDTLYVFLSDGERAKFEQLYLQYVGNTLTWYRGFNCSHFSYPEIQRGTLRSEGDADVPTFTMGNGEAVATRWLPGCFEKIVAEEVSISGTDHFTLTLGDTNDVPLAITVRCDVGANSGRRICWLNSAEQVVRGPLIAADFRICSILWVKHGQFDMARCDLGCDRLPPARPYKPSSAQLIADWWVVCKAWLDTNYVTHRGLTFTRLDLTGLAPPSYGVNG